MPSLLQVALIKETSKLALCATSTGELPQNSMNFSIASLSFGAPFTISPVMPVISVIRSGIDVSGSTNVQNSSKILLFLILTAPISIILSDTALSPVVSRSKHINSPSSALSSSPVTIGIISFTK